jgi:hypothetical protein
MHLVRSWSGLVGLVVRLAVVWCESALIMAKARFRCRHCGKLKPKRNADQRYCGEADCQKARKNTWRRERYASDPDYRLNQRDSTTAWLESNGGAAAYYRRYRRRRGQVGTEANVVKGKAKAVEMSAPSDQTATRANSDALLQKNLAISGRYELIPLDGANSDAFQAEIRLISRC